MLTFQVDFNDQTEDGQLIALLRLASNAAKSPHAGDRAALRDSEGNRCEGRVVRIDGALAYVAPDWETWSPAQDLLRRKVTVIYQQDGDNWHATSADLPDLSVRGESREMVRARVYEYLRRKDIESPFEVDVAPVGESLVAADDPLSQRFGHQWSPLIMTAADNR